ncbi:MAG: hypothetical protein K2J30_01705, partial [Clostridia bacterium]|nr:hypothetical protein [Clostridia bacterium]
AAFSSDSDACLVVAVAGLVTAATAAGVEKIAKCARNGIAARIAGVTGITHRITSLVKYYGMAQGAPSNYRNTFYSGGKF